MDGCDGQIGLGREQPKFQWGYGTREDMLGPTKMTILANVRAKQESQAIPYHPKAL
eukprot:COSAG02_NODE_56033_length_287_cov_1.090426_1_plen_55_part_01